MEKSQLDLSEYRLAKAQEDLESAESNLQNNNLRTSTNRSYYSMFHAIRALLALDSFDSAKHSGVIAYFNLHYVKTKKIETNYSKMITSAFRIRTKSDYNDFYVVTQKEASDQLDNAKKFLKRIRTFIKSMNLHVEEESPGE